MNRARKNVELCGLLGCGGSVGAKSMLALSEIIEGLPPPYPPPPPHPCSPLPTPKMWDKSKHVYIGYVDTIYVAESCDGFIRLSLVHTVKKYP